MKKPWILQVLMILLGFIVFTASKGELHLYLESAETSSTPLFLIEWGMTLGVGILAIGAFQLCVSSYEEYDIDEIKNGVIITFKSRFPHPNPWQAEFHVMALTIGKRNYLVNINKNCPELIPDAQYEKTKDGFKRVDTNEIIVFA